MEWIRRVFRSEIRESHIGVALIVCLIVLIALSLALVWQSPVLSPPLAPLLCL